MSPPQSARTTWRAFFLSPTGRFTRSQYWGATFTVYGAMFVYMIPLFAFADSTTDWGPSQIVYIIGLTIVIIAVGISHFCATVKRFHDRDKAWPWIFIGLAPYIGGLWILIECGCLAGTPGRNRFGADPQNPEGDIVDVFGGSLPAPPLHPSIMATESRPTLDDAPRTATPF